ncbi:Coq4 family protein [Glacieibacterium megasporae]|uniref:Coq4 family protein n=1 Tax=Glacieibacterium megasporae TaxID=2835787 RepID=UPI0021031BFC|nr:Coq4 family protein [Polymorphobacter megasporae]
MNAMTPPSDFVITAPKRDWLKALRAVRRLLADKDDTVQVFEIMRSLNGRATRDGYLQLLRTAQGGRIAYQRRELPEVLMDRATLATYPAGSVAAHYLAFTEAGQISADGLADVSRQAARPEGIDLVHPVAWYGRRIRDTHDLWHILTGYDLTGLGEACLVAFSYAQTKALGWALIGTGAALRGARQPGHKFARAIWEGYRRGRSAAWLPGQDYEALLAEPLEAARARLGLRPPALFDAIPVAARNHALPKTA